MIRLALPLRSSILPVLCLALALTACTKSEHLPQIEESSAQDTLSVTVSISGSVTYIGAIPLNRERDDAGMRRELIRVDEATDGLEGAAVHLKFDPATTIETDTDFPDLHVTQTDFEFQPAVLAIRSGQRIVFGNDDPANHNVRTTSSNPKNEFNVMATTGHPYEKVFGIEADAIPIQLSCDIHRWMQGWIYVFEHPYYAVTDAQGRFEIPEVPKGRYTLVVEHPAVGLRAEEPVELRSTYTLHCGFNADNLEGASSPVIEGAVAN